MRKKKGEYTGKTLLKAERLDVSSHRYNGGHGRRKMEVEIDRKSSRR